MGVSLHLRKSSDNGPKPRKTWERMKSMGFALRLRK
jgi:hypothetical protein